MATNADERLLKYRERWINLEQERRDRSEDIRELAKEMKGVGVGKDEIAGVRLSVRRHFEAEEARAKRVSAEEIAASLGSYADTPLGEAAVKRAA